MASTVLHHLGLCLKEIGFLEMSSKSHHRIEENHIEWKLLQ